MLRMESNSRRSEMPVSTAPASTVGTRTEPNLVQPVASLAAGIVFRRRNGLLSALFLLCAGVVLFCNLGGYRTLVWHEGRVAVPAREMMESGDWIVPRFGQWPRLAKPPLSYWMVAGCAKLFGTLNEWVVRFPQAISALLLSVLMGWWARRWYGGAVGWAAAFVQLTSAWVLIFGRKADVDMTVWLLTTASLYLVATQPDGENRRRGFLRWFVIYALLAVSWLAKFHYGPVMVLAPVVLFFLIRKQPGQLFFLFHPVGLLLLAGAVFIWPWLVLQQLPEAWEVWREETVGRAVGELGTQPLWYYFPRVFSYTLPWTPFAVGMIRQSWRDAWQRNAAREQFLWIWFLTHFVIVTLQPNKHTHYIFSALPVFTLLAARGLMGTVEKLQKGEWRIGFRVAVLATFLAVGGTAIAWQIAQVKWPYLSMSVAAVAVLFCTGLVGTLWLLYRCRWIPAALTIGLAFLAGFVVIQTRILPQRDYRLSSARFASRMRKEVGPATTVYVYHTKEDPFLFYLNSPVCRYDEIDYLEKALQRHHRILVMTFETAEPELKHLGQVRILHRQQADPHMPPPKRPFLFLVELQKEESSRSAGPAVSTRSEVIPLHGGFRR